MEELTPLRWQQRAIGVSSVCILASDGNRLEYEPEHRFRHYKKRCSKLIRSASGFLFWWTSMSVAKPNDQLMTTSNLRPPGLTAVRNMNWSCVVREAVCHRENASSLLLSTGKGKDPNAVSFDKVNHVFDRTLAETPLLPKHLSCGFWLYAAKQR